MIPVMIVSEDPVLRKKVRSAFEGLPVLFSKDSSKLKDAVEIYKADQPPIVVMDLFMEQQEKAAASGLDLLKALKKANNKVCVILLLRVGNRAAVERAFRYGADDVLVWPVSDDILASSLLHRAEILELLHEKG